MGSSYSDLNLYYKLKNGTINVPNNKESNTYSIETKKQNFNGSTNFEKVTHTITFTPPEQGLNYNVLLYDGVSDTYKGNNIFGYYYPRYDTEVLKEVNVYNHVVAPNIPLIFSFVTRGSQTYNFTIDSLLSTKWVKASNITKYASSKGFSAEDLTKQFKRLLWNKKIKFEVGKKVVDIWRYKQKLDETNYKLVYIPKGDNSILGSECLFNLEATKFKLTCPDPPKASEANENSQPNSSKHNNTIDPYYLDTFNGHFFDGIMVYFTRESATNVQKSVQNGKNQNNNDQSYKEYLEKYEDNMALLLEFIDDRNSKRFLKRNDKDGTYWTEEKVEYTDDAKLNEQLTKIKSSATTNEIVTFILEKKDNFKGVTISPDDKIKSTYSKYTQSAKESKKPNILFQKKETKIGTLDTSSFKTKSLDVYFLKVNNDEDPFPFLIMFTNEKNVKPQQPPTPPPAKPENDKKCYFFNNSYDFDNWQELTADDKKEEKEKKEGGKNDLDKKLEKKLAKIEEYGACAVRLDLLRKIAYEILIGTDEEEIKKKVKEDIKKRPDVTPLTPERGISVLVVLGYVAAGLVVTGIMVGVFYGIYWYNTTIKLLT